ncbi:hypothetical protein Hdeb2414_s0006g00208151 [Helianthus debilis subsp. tardiflorus]
MPLCRMLSRTAKSSGVKLEIVMTILKQCNIANRPVGYQCGGSCEAPSGKW